MTRILLSALGGAVCGALGVYALLPDRGGAHPTRGAPAMDLGDRAGLCPSRPAAARGWVMSLPAGEERDGALAALLSAAASSDDDVDRGVLSAFSSDARRQQAMVSVIAQLALRRPEAARAMRDEHVSDPALRARAEALLERNADIGRYRTVDELRAGFALQPVVSP
ncbi:MAG TPA: hypothetical protein VF329_10475 [Gammaproteobacteria bacterium]